MTLKELVPIKECCCRRIKCVMTESECMLRVARLNQKSHECLQCLLTQHEAGSFNFRDVDQRARETIDNFVMFIHRSPDCSNQRDRRSIERRQYCCQISLSFSGFIMLGGFFRLVGILHFAHNSINKTNKPFVE